ncbi:uncharacterized protein LOC118977430 [Sturnira hondurensis]|uniref:uncharacterized protein LOC118977430 n=1 Tax=Sturnira hondurensis TaxID=192404 RepID=UPI001879DB00|nr:uncharacterized protein LOC118977430 [Sturnira hondurensis]
MAAKQGSVQRGPTVCLLCAPVRTGRTLAQLCGIRVPISYYRAEALMGGISSCGDLWRMPRPSPLARTWTSALETDFSSAASTPCSQKAKLIGPVSHHLSSWPSLALSHLKVCCYLFLGQQPCGPSSPLEPAAGRRGLGTVGAGAQSGMQTMLRWMRTETWTNEAMCLDSSPVSGPDEDEAELLSQRDGAESRTVLCVRSRFFNKPYH